MGLQILVEDRYFEAYEALVHTHLGMAKPNRSRVQAQRVNWSEITNASGWLSLLETVYSAGKDCCIVVVDHEGPNSIERNKLLVQVQRAFATTCRRLQRMRVGAKLKQMKVSLVITQSCLECWQLADVGAVVTFARGRHGPRINPRQPGRTEHVAPAAAARALSDIFAEVDRRSGRRPLRSYEKSSSVDICKEVNVSQARQRNASLDYFLHQVDCEYGGCDRQQILSDH